MKTKSIYVKHGDDFNYVTQRQLDLIMACMDAPTTIKEIESALGISTTQFVGGFYKLIEFGYINKIGFNLYQAVSKNYVVGSTTDVQIWRQIQTKFNQPKDEQVPKIQVQLPDPLIVEQIKELTKKRMNRTDIAKKLGLKKSIVLWTLEHLKGMKA